MNSERLQLWKKRLNTNKTAYDSELTKMDEREQMYRGEYTFVNQTNREDDREGESVIYVYNALAENIEAQVSSDIPQPKVTARRKKDEHLAVIIENMIRNELDRLPMELINDLAERVVSIQGGGFYLLEWDNSCRSHGSVGENAVTFVHPKWVIPQNGVYDSVQNMDYVILRIPQTKESLRARYGVDLEDESEEESDIRNASGGDTAEDMVTQYIAYYRNDRGGIGKYSWVNNEELEDLEDYQARHLCRCGRCGTIEPIEGTVIAKGDEEPYEWTSGSACPVCGAKDWSDSEEEYEEITGPVYRTDGTPVPGTDGSDGMLTDMTAVEIGSSGEMIGMPMEGSGTGSTIMIPYYKPDMFPLILQRNVSVFGRLLGESDADKQAPMQHGLNRLERKIFDRLLKAGDKIALPDDPMISIDTKDQTVWRVGSAQDLSMIRQFQFSGNVEQELVQVNAIYQQMRQTIGVTDSFQGRRDTTATSGTAKQFAAAQAAGRMESKRVMKERAYAELFEMMFKFRLAYADEPRPVVYQDGHGDTVYDQFSKWDFLEMDESGSYWWNDQFLFSCDTTAPLANNRERMWQETTQFFSAGAFGNPTELATIVEYWRLMETLHYPGAAERRSNLQERLEREEAAQQEQAASGMASDADVEEMARQAAMADAADQAASASAARSMGIE